MNTFKKYLVSESTIDGITPEQKKEFEERVKRFNTHQKAYDSIHVGIRKIFDDIRKGLTKIPVVDDKFKKNIRDKISKFIFGIKGLDFDDRVKNQHVDFWTDYLTDAFDMKDPMARHKPTGKK